jgi:hypothetical protein
MWNEVGLIVLMKEGKDLGSQAFEMGDPASKTRQNSVQSRRDLSVDGLGGFRLAF